LSHRHAQRGIHSFQQLLVSVRGYIFLCLCEVGCFVLGTETEGEGEGDANGERDSKEEDVEVETEAHAGHVSIQLDNKMA